jgi:hypothetical protein
VSGLVFTPDQLAAIAAASEEAETDERRKYNRVGVRLGGTPGLLITMFSPLFVAAFAIFGLIFYLQGHTMTLQYKEYFVFWICGVAFAIFFGAPFVFLRLRRALVVVGVLLVILVVGLLMDQALLLGLLSLVR